MRRAFWAGVLAVLLAGCGATPAQQQALVSGAVTLASIAAQDNVKVSTLVLGGALFCKKVAAAQAPTVALANLAGVPVSVVGQTSGDVAQACAAVQSVPVKPPADPASAPVVSAAVALSAV